MRHAQSGMAYNFIELEYFIMQSPIFSRTIFGNRYLLYIMKAIFIHVETKESYDSVTNVFQ